MTPGQGAVLTSQGLPNKYHAEWLIVQEVIVSQFWRLEVWNQGVSGAMLFLWSLWGRFGPGLSLSHWRCPQALGLPCSYLHGSNLCSRLTCLLLCEFSLPLVRTGLELLLLWSHLNLITLLSPYFQKDDAHALLWALSPLLIWTGGSTPLLYMEGVPDLPVAPQDEAGLTKTFQTWPRGWFHIP